MTIEGKIRKDIITAAYSAKKIGAHIAPSLSLVEIVLAILSEYDKKIDCFVLSKGHGALGYYSVMHQLNMITDEQFDSFECDGGDFPGQPSRSESNTIQFSSGSLGMGLSYALGVALSQKKVQSGKTYVVLGDGELNEGSNWESATLAGRYELDNLIAVVDNNGLQSDGALKDIMGDNIHNMFDSCGWSVVDCDGHSVKNIVAELRGDHIDKPLVIIAHTIKGRGVSFMEGNNSWHHAILNEENYYAALQDIATKYGDKYE